MERLKVFNSSSNDLLHQSDLRKTQLRVRVQIPKQYKKEPVISDLITGCGITVNIQAALLSASAHEDGWFDLELCGTTKQIQDGLMYLNDLDLKIWKSGDEENW